MSKSAKKRTVISSATSGPVARPAGQTAAESESKKADPGSKQSRVIAIVVDRGGPGCLNRFSASISGASAGVRLPSGVAAG
jgi:hypothetical protein